MAGHRDGLAPQVHFPGVSLFNRLPGGFPLAKRSRIEKSSSRKTSSPATASTMSNGHHNGTATNGFAKNGQARGEHRLTEDIESPEVTRPSVDNTDDPVRMYLMQMGEIPMLNRAEEIDAARTIEDERTRYRHSMLATDYVLQGAVKALEQVRDGQLRLDRTIEVSVTNTTEKKNIMRRLEPNLKTLRRLLQQNHRDFQVAISRARPKKQRRNAWMLLVRRRNKAVRLVEELNLRTSRLQPLFDKL